MPTRRARLTSVDWLLLLASLVGGGMVGYLGLLVGMRLLLEPRIVGESALRLSKQVELVEAVLQTRPLDALPTGVVIRRDPDLGQSQTMTPSRFDRLVQEAMRRDFRLERHIVRDQPPLQDPWGGHWVRLRSRDPQGQVLWLYQSERLSNSIWYLPLLRILVIVVGGFGGLVLFLRAKVERPLSLMLQRLSEQNSAGPLPLLPEEGIGPIRLLSLRINRLLERINNTGRARRQLLHGLTHDLGGPHARLMLRTELLCERLEGEPAAIAQAIEPLEHQGVVDRLVALQSGVVEPEAGLAAAEQGQQLVKAGEVEGQMAEVVVDRTAIEHQLALLPLGPIRFAGPGSGPALLGQQRIDLAHPPQIGAGGDRLMLVIEGTLGAGPPPQPLATSAGGTGGQQPGVAGRHQGGWRPGFNGAPEAGMVLLNLSERNRNSHHPKAVEPGHRRGAMGGVN